MNEMKIGLVIKKARLDKNLTQNELACLLHVTSQAVSKWERGLGFPDISILINLANILGLNMEDLLKGELSISDNVNGNMKKLHFYICPTCHNITTSLTSIKIGCCGKNIHETKHQKCLDDKMMKIENSEDDIYVEVNSPMSKEHYVSFIAYLTSDKIMLTKLYPEGTNCTRFHKVGHGQIYCYDNQSGLWYKNI